MKIINIYSGSDTGEAVHVLGVEHDDGTVAPIDNLLYDSETNECVTFTDLDIDATAYRELVAESLTSAQAEGHVRTEHGRRVYAWLP